MDLPIKLRLLVGISIFQFAILFVSRRNFPPRLTAF